MRMMINESCKCVIGGNINQGSWYFLTKLSLLSLVAVRSRSLSLFLKKTRQESSVVFDLVGAGIDHAGLDFTRNFKFGCLVGG
jgi:hypothetical protein